VLIDAIPPSWYEHPPSGTSLLSALLATLEVTATLLLCGAVFELGKACYRRVRARWRFITLPLFVYFVLFAAGVLFGLWPTIPVEALEDRIACDRVALACYDTRDGPHYTLLGVAPWRKWFQYDLTKNVMTLQDAGGITDLPSGAQTRWIEAISTQSKPIGWNDILSEQERATDRLDEKRQSFTAWVRRVMGYSELGGALEDIYSSVFGFGHGYDLGRWVVCSLRADAYARAFQDGSLIGHVRNLGWRMRLLYALSETGADTTGLMTAATCTCFLADIVTAEDPHSEFSYATQANLRGAVELFKRYGDAAYADAIVGMERAVSHALDGSLEARDMAAIDRFEAETRAGGVWYDHLAAIGAAHDNFAGIDREGNGDAARALGMVAIVNEHPENRCSVRGDHWRSIRVGLNHRYVDVEGVSPLLPEAWKAGQ